MHSHTTMRVRPLRVTGLVLGLILGLIAGAGCAKQPLTRLEDASPPQLEIVSPAAGDRVGSFTPTIEVRYHDAKSGVRAVTFEAQINGRDHSADFDHLSGGAVGAVSSATPLPLGENHLQVRVADRNGNVGHAEARFLVAAGGWLALESAPGAAPRRHVEIVLDASGSMAEALGLDTRMQVAKNALGTLVDGLPADTPLGLRAFSGCDQIESLVPIQPVDRRAFSRKLAGVNPAAGTPLVASLLESFEALERFPRGQRVSVLVTDGGEACGGDLDEAVSRALDARTRVIVIGFGIADQGLLGELRSLAERTGGAYFDAIDQHALETALHESVLRLTYLVFDESGEQVGAGAVDGEPVEVPTGPLRVRLDTSPPVIVADVVVAELARTTVVLTDRGAGIRASVNSPQPVAVSAMRPAVRASSEGSQP